MRQIPKYAIIGLGRLGKHLQHYFALLNIECATWSRSSDDIEKLREVTSDSDIILILIKDDQIDNFIGQHLTDTKKTLIHFSGSLYTDKATGMHPLASFSDNLYDLEFYKRIAFIIDNKNINFTEVFPAFKNPYYYIEPKMKPFYHALCVMSGNFTSILWSKLFNDLEDKLQIPKEAAFPYLEIICNNLEHDYKKSLTGPLVRGDMGTINRNLASLDDDPYKIIYESFVKVFNLEKNNADK